MLKIIAAVAITFVVSFSGRAQSSTSPTNLDDPATLEKFLQQYDCNGLKGKLAVFGILRDQHGNPVSPATVQLLIDQVGQRLYPVRNDGTYCIRYEATRTITALVFSRPTSDATCVEQISGDRSHYINKVFDNTCFNKKSPQPTVGLLPSETKRLLGSRIARDYIAIQKTIVNSTGEDVRLLSAGFETTVFAANNATPTTSAQQPRSAPSPVQPVSSQVLMSMAVPHEDLVTVLRVGPVVIGAVRRRQSVDEAALQRVAFRENEIVPDRSAVTRYIFVRRSALSPTAADSDKTLAKAISDLGTLVVIAHGLNTAREFRFFNDLVEATGGLPASK
jgi:hypothetical protein